MAELPEGHGAAVDAVLKQLAGLAADVRNATNAAGVEHKAAAVRNLAEAYAWLRSPNQPHGGASATPTS